MKRIARIFDKLICKFGLHPTSCGDWVALSRICRRYYQPQVVKPAVIDAAHLAHQRQFSEKTFGPGRRTGGVLDHIRKELKEIEDDPGDLAEWVDVIILAFDGAWRAGWDAQQIIDAIKTKQAENERRDWPDWRLMSADRAIEHVRSSPAAEIANLAGQEE